MDERANMQKIFLKSQAEVISVNRQNRILEIDRKDTLDSIVTTNYIYKWKAIR